MGYHHSTRIYSKKVEIAKKFKLDCTLEAFLIRDMPIESELE